MRARVGSDAARFRATRLYPAGGYCSTTVFYKSLG